VGKGQDSQKKPALLNRLETQSEKDFAKTSRKVSEGLQDRECCLGGHGKRYGRRPPEFRREAAAAGQIGLTERGEGADGPTKVGTHLEGSKKEGGFFGKRIGLGA